MHGEMIDVFHVLASPIQNKLITKSIYAYREQQGWGWDSKLKG